MMLVYYKGKGVWFDFPSVDSPKRNNAYRKWVAENIPDTSEGDCNEDDWEKFPTKLAEWNKSNPPPKYKVVEDEISLEKERFFDFSEPVLSYQPEEADVFALFKLKAKDERQLRYEGEITVSILLPCDHPDGDRSGFFFQLDAPKTFTRNDIVLDEPDKPANSETRNKNDNKMNDKAQKQLDVAKPVQDGINVFFIGYGAWYGLFSDYSGERITSCQATGNCLTKGFFRLSEEDEMTQNYTKNYNYCERLYPSTHPKDEFTKFMKEWGEFEREQWHREVHEDGRSSAYYHLEGFVFMVDTSRERKFFDPDKLSQPEDMGDADVSIQAITEPNEQELTQWLRETWDKELRVGGTAFFRKLKKYVNQKGSPIIEHYSAGTDAGFSWRTSKGTSGEMKKSTLLNKVSIFKKTP